MKRSFPLALVIVLGALSRPGVVGSASASASPPARPQIHRRSEKIAGIVVDEDGIGVGSARLSAFANSLEPDPRGIAETGPDGSFEIVGLYRGVHDLVVEAPGHARRTLARVEAGSRQVRISLTLLRAVEGRVFDAASGEGLPAFVLEAREVAPSGSGEFRRTGLGERPFKGGDGRFVFEGLEPGRYTLLARAAGHAQAYSREFEIAREREIQPLEIGLSRGCRLVGRLVDGKSGEGVSGATIRTLDGDFEDNPFVEIFRQFLVMKASPATVRTESDGSYVLDHLMPGTYQLQIEHPSFTNRRVKDLAVQEGRDRHVPEIPLFPGASLRGLVVDRSGSPLANAIVTVRPSANSRLRVPLLCRTWTDDHGRFVAHKLPSGECLVGVSPGREDPPNPFMILHGWPTRKAVLLEDGEEVEVRVVVGR